MEKEKNNFTKGYIREKNSNPISFDTEGNLIDQITKEQGTMMLPEITVRGISPETRAKNYSSVYHPEDALEFLDIMTKPITAPITPSLQVGAIRNALNGRSYYKSLMGIEPNLGITTENFNKEHPYLSMGANLTFDMLSPFVLKGLNRGVNAASTFVGKKYVAPYVASRTLNKGINANPKGQILVSDSYFNSPNNWYRITNTPEIYGIKEMGKNVTTRDAVDIGVPSKNWRNSVLDQPFIRDKEGFLMLDPNRNERRFRLFQKSGSAHGNTSQASKGQVWSGSISNSSMFPTVILEGQAARQVPMGISRTNFKLTPWEDIPMGQRIGFHTGEMPLDNLGYFQKLGNGKYSYQGTIIPDKRININTFNSFDLSSPLKNGQWDMPTITQQIKEGGSKAVDFLGSQTRLDTYNYNRNLANRLGFGSIEEPYNSIVRVRKPFQVKFNTNTLSNEGGSFIPGKTAQQDIVEINLTHDIEPAAFHETLHRGSYGMGSLEGLDNMSEFRNTNRFYEYLSDKLKKPWSEQPTSMRDYLDKPGELPVNVLELGQRMGIQIGQKYPGSAQFNTIIEQFKKANPNDGKLFILDYLNMNKPKRVWDALSGQYFTALPAIYGGYKATEE